MQDRRNGVRNSGERKAMRIPATTYGIEKYLGSGLIKGVGPEYAKRIVEKFGKILFYD